MTVQALPAAAPLPSGAFEPSVADAGCGALATEHGNLPLESIDVQAAVTGLTARVVLSQRFRNPHAEPLEATYVFPLPDRGAVTGMRMEADGHVVDAVLQERGEARATYDRAIREGKRASIVEEERPDVFTMRVGNILPGEAVTIRLTLDQPLPWADGEATFRFPLVVAPRYVPGEAIGGEQAGSGHAPDTTATPDASRISPPVLLPGFPHPVALSISAAVDPGGLPLGGVRSSLHTVVADGSTYRVQPGERVDGQHDDAEGTFQLTVLPPASAAPPAPRDVVVVLDRSGSMHGWKMVAARRAAARIVDTLTDHDRFAVLAFDNHVERPPLLASGLVAATDRNRFRAVEHLAGMTARGGTEMLAPLREAVGLLVDGERDRVLVLVTDGQVGDEDQILSTLQPGLSGVRVHTVGIDRAVNAGFLTRLAVLGGGRCELVESEDRLDEAADHIHQRIATPLVTGIRLHADGSDAGGMEIVDGTVAPTRLPALVPGVPLVITGRWRGSPGSLAVTGVAADGSPWRASARAADVSVAPAVGAVWARAHLRDLEDAYLTADPGTLGATERRIVATSLRFGVLCRFTAYVAVDSRVVTDGASPHRIMQPVEQPSGWEMLPGGPPPMPLSARARGGATASVYRAESLDMAASDVEVVASFRPAPASTRLGSAPQPPMSPAPAPGGPGPNLRPQPPADAGASDPLLWAREQAATELRLLRDAEVASAQLRWIALADLASRLRATAVALTAPGMPPTDITAEVAALADAILHGNPGMLDALWRRAVVLLQRLATVAGSGIGSPPPGTAVAPTPPVTTMPPSDGSGPKPRAFWKR